MNRGTNFQQVDKRQGAQFNIGGIELNESEKFHTFRMRGKPGWLALPYPTPGPDSKHAGTAAEIEKFTDEGEPEVAQVAQGQPAVDRSKDAGQMSSFLQYAIIAGILYIAFVSR